MLTLLEIEQVGQHEKGTRQMARPTGVEPVTPTFGGWCSIQLSYERVAAILACERRNGHLAGSADLGCTMNGEPSGPAEIRTPTAFAAQ